MPEREDFKAIFAKIDGVIAGLTSVSAYQEAESKGALTTERQQRLVALKEKLRVEIFELGGLEAIDAWIDLNKAGLRKISEFGNSLDLKWLEK